MEQNVQPRSKRTRTEAAPTTDDAVVSRLLVQAVSNAVVQTGSQVLNDLIASDQEELQQVSWTSARPSSPQLLPSSDLQRAASCSGAALPPGELWWSDLYERHPARVHSLPSSARSLTPRLTVWAVTAGEHVRAYSVVLAAGAAGALSTVVGGGVCVL